MFILAFLWLAVAIVVGVAAQGRGRSGLGWFILSVLISPLLACLLLIVLPNLHLQAMLEAPYRAQQVHDAALRKAIKEGRGTQGNQVHDAALRKAIKEGRDAQGNKKVAFLLIVLAVGGGMLFLLHNSETKPPSPSAAPPIATPAPIANPDTATFDEKFKSEPMHAPTATANSDDYGPYWGLASERVIDMAAAFEKRMAESNRPKPLKEVLKQSLITKDEVRQARAALSLIVHTDAKHAAQAQKLLDLIWNDEKKGERLMEAAAAAHGTNQKQAKPEQKKSRGDGQMAGEPGDRNEANRRLLALSEKDRRNLFAVQLGISGEVCSEVTRTFYKGSAKPSWNAIWNVECKGGPSYSILVMSDEKGSTKVMTCGELRAAGGGECFVRN